MEVGRGQRERVRGGGRHRSDWGPFASREQRSGLGELAVEESEVGSGMGWRTCECGRFGRQDKHNDSMWEKRQR